MLPDLLGEIHNAQEAMRFGGWNVPMPPPLEILSPVLSIFFFKEESINLTQSLVRQYKTGMEKSADNAKEIFLSHSMASLSE